MNDESIRLRTKYKAIALSVLSANVTMGGILGISPSSTRMLFLMGAYAYIISMYHTLKKEDQIGILSLVTSEAFYWALFINIIITIPMIMRWS